MRPIQEVEWEACLLEPRRDPALETEVRRALGDVPSGLRYFAASPWIARSLLSVNQYQVRLVHVDFPLADLVSLVVSQDNSCRYCYATQRMLMRLQGVPDGRIRQIEDDLHRAQLDPRERAALAFARELSRASPLATHASLQQLRDMGWSEPAIKELAFIAAADVYLNRVHTLPAIPPERIERLSVHWRLRWIAPFARRVLRAHQLRGAPEPLPEEMRRGPYAYLVLALEGLPAALALRRLLDAAFASPVLPPRTKALVFAVVARGLGCPLSEQEASRALRETGLSDDDVGDVLAHLASPKLGEVDAAVVPFARATIRYRPVDVQRHARRLREKMEPAQFLELMGISSLANAVCRLGVIAGGL